LQNNIQYFFLKIYKKISSLSALTDKELKGFKDYFLFFLESVIVSAEAARSVKRIPELSPVFGLEEAEDVFVFVVVLLLFLLLLLLLLLPLCCALAMAGTAAISS